MNFHSIFTTMIDQFKKNPFPSTFGIAGLIFFAYGLISLLGSSQPQKTFIFENENDAFLSESTKSSEMNNLSIFVDIEGAVSNPGVYKINFDSRIKDAIIAAGGLSQDADRQWVSKNINLAAKVKDGAKLYIPKEGESAGLINNTSDNSILGSETSSQVNINSASLSELDTLPGIGMVTASKIVEGRPYGDIQELLNKKIVGQSVFDKIKDKITSY